MCDGFCWVAVMPSPKFQEPIARLSIIENWCRSRITTGSKGGLDGGIRLGENRDVGVLISTSRQPKLLVAIRVTVKTPDIA